MFLKRDTKLVTDRAARAVRCVAGWLLLLLGVAASGAGAAIPGKIDLNEFDALMKSIELPDGETLAYVALGNPAGAPVVLIHGYTDSARDIGYVGYVQLTAAGGIIPQAATLQPLTTTLQYTGSF